jgi:hypothetical protein
MRMLTRSAKAKGRRLQNHVRDEIQRIFGLTPLDVQGTTMGLSGMDIQLSERARGVLPFSIECKNVARIAALRFFEQAEAHAKRTGLLPAVVMKENHGRPKVIIDLSTFLYLVRESRLSGPHSLPGAVRHDNAEEQS